MILMHIDTIKEQLRNNAVAIISLIVAIIAVSYNVRREESTERNRNFRTAGFEVLKNLGELQIIVNHVHYQPDHSLANPYLGWGHVAMINDMSQLLPSPIPENAEKLSKVWSENWKNLKESEEAVDAVSQEIDVNRRAVVSEIKNLN